jgi:hypothetical protein
MQLRSEGEKRIAGISSHLTVWEQKGVHSASQNMAGPTLDSHPAVSFCQTDRLDVSDFYLIGSKRNCCTGLDRLAFVVS